MAPFTHAVGGDPNTGELPQVVVDWLSGRIIPASADDGQVLTWDASSGAWEARSGTSVTVDGTVYEPVDGTINLPVASTTSAGAARLATDTQAVEGTSPSLAVTPTGLSAKVSDALTTVTRTNLAERPTGAGSLNGWSTIPVNQYDPAVVTDVVRRPGTSAHRVTRTTVNPALILAQWNYAGQAVGYNADSLAVAPSQPVTVSVYLRCSVTARGRVLLTFRDNAGTAIGAEIPGTMTPMTAGTWTRVSFTATAPANAARVSVQVQTLTETGSPSTGGELSWAQDLLVEQGSTLSDYFDGGMADTDDAAFEWTGTAHASRSVQREAKFVQPDQVPPVVATVMADESTTPGNRFARHDALGLHHVRRADIKRRKGGVIGTGGKSVLAFQIAHQLDPFKATIWPEFRSRGIPVGWGAVTGAVGDPADSYEPTTATWEDVRQHFYEGAEVWAHSRTHLEPQPIGTDGGDTIQGEIQGAREDIEAAGLLAMGWQTAGVYPVALTPYYNDFMGPSSQDMNGWSSEVGQRLLSNYGLLSLIAASGKRFLPTDGSEGLGYWTFDNQSLATTKAQMDLLVDRPGHGLVLAMHPKNIGLPGMMNFADFAAVLDYAKQLWDDGKIEIVSQSGMAFADPGTDRRADILVDNSFEGGTTTSTWGLLSGAVRATTGGRTGQNFLRLPAGTAAYGTQGPGPNLRVWGGHGMLWMVDVWARNPHPTNPSQARIRVYANRPSGVHYLVDRNFDLPAGATDWSTARRIRVPVGCPTDATNLVIQLMRAGTGDVEYDDAHMYAV